ncbi:MAG: translation machinery-associated protein 20, partial [Paramarteilia canceri]
MVSSYTHMYLVKSFFIMTQYKFRIRQRSELGSSTLKNIKEQLIKSKLNLTKEILENILNEQKLKIENGRFEEDDIILFNNQIWFFKNGHKSVTWYPTLHFVHKYPDLFPKSVTDKHAVLFILNGADVMAPGILPDLSSDTLQLGSIV